MTYTVLVVIVLILVSGFVAYFGDILGRRMGKKRLTLFNLRPRYTAIVVTTITGMIISALVLGAALSLNAEFRKGFFQYGQILKRSRLLATENGQMALRSKQLRIEVAKQRRELDDALKDAKLAKEQRDKAVGVVDRLRKEIAQRQKELLDVRKRQGIAESDLKQREAELRLTMASLEAANKRVLFAQSNLKEVEKKLDLAKASLQQTQSLLGEAESTLAASRDIGLSAADLALKLRMSEIAFRQGDELARGLIDPEQSSFELRRDIYALLEKASAKAVEGGAQIGSNNRAVSVMFWQQVDQSGAISNQNETECVDMAVKKISTSSAEVMVQVVCGMNTLPDAQVPVELRLYINGLVYKAGDEVASRKIDGRQSEGHILLALTDFLQNEAAKDAMRAGVVPVSGQDARTTLGPNPQDQADELLQIVGKIKDLNTTAEVSIHATKEIRTADSLNMDNIRFGVTKAE